MSERRFWLPVVNPDINDVAHLEPGYDASDGWWTNPPRHDD